MLYAHLGTLPIGWSPSAAFDVRFLLCFVGFVPEAELIFSDCVAVQQLSQFC